MAARVDSHTDKEKQKGIGFMKAKMRTNTEPEVTTDMSTTTDTSTTVESEDDDTILLDRNTYKSIKKMDRATLEGLIQDIFERGRKKGLAEAGVIIAEDAECSDDGDTLDLRAVEAKIKAIRGIGEKRAEEIMLIFENYLRI